MIIGGLVFLILCLGLALVGVMWNYGKKNEAEQNADRTMVLLLVISGIIVFIMFAVKGCQ